MDKEWFTIEYIDDNSIDLYSFAPMGSFNEESLDNEFYEF